MEPTLLIAVSDKIIEGIAALPRTSKSTHNVAPQCYGISFYSCFECLLVDGALVTVSNKIYNRTGEGRISEGGDDVLTTYINNMRKTHHMAVGGVKIDVVCLKEFCEFLHESAVVCRVIEGPMAYCYGSSKLL